MNKIELNKIYNEDCLEGMKRIPDGSVDMILADLPYGTTACKWDTIIPFDLLWEQYERIIKDNGVIALTASQPFTSALVMSNPRLFKYEWIWVKNNSTGFQLAKVMPLKKHESILVFSKGNTYPRSKNIASYNPQGLRILDKINKRSSKGGYLTESGIKKNEYIQKYTNYPTSVLEFDKETKTTHPTQKPVDLFEYLIKTYTNEGETVLDNVMGSGTTAIACLNTNRNFIGFELDKGYFDIANERIEEHEQQLKTI